MSPRLAVGNTSGGVPLEKLFVGQLENRPVAAFPKHTSFSDGMVTSVAQEVSDPVLGLARLRHERTIAASDP